jgi:hypothetical protein
MVRDAASSASLGHFSLAVVLAFGFGLTHERRKQAFAHLHEVGLTS